jgi:hypothetical protein
VGCSLPSPASGGRENGGHVSIGRLCGPSEVFTESQPTLADDACVPDYHEADVDPLMLNDQVLRGLELRAVVQLARGCTESCASVLQVAVSFAARNHPGWFMSPTIERAIVELGSTIESDDLPRSRPDGPVAHVLAGPAAELLVDARNWWGGDRTCRIVPLPDVADGVIDAASRLRADIAGSSLVVIHGPGIAVAPLIALAGWSERPPVVTVESSRTAFWAGVAVSDMVVHWSNAAMALAVERRCLPAERGVLVERHERQSAEGLLGVLNTCIDRSIRLGRPRVPNALLPSRPSAIDRWSLAQQVESGLADGLSAAIKRWPLPFELQMQPGWVVLARDAEATMATLHTLLDCLPGDYPDIVIVNAENDQTIADMSGDLAGVAMVLSTGHVMSDEMAERVGRRQMIMDRVLVVSDGMYPNAVFEDEFGIDSVDDSVMALLHQVLDDESASAVTLEDVPPGEVFKLVMNHEAGAAAHVTITSDGTRVRGDVEITEKRDELFHTETKARSGVPVDSGTTDGAI